MVVGANTNLREGAGYQLCVHNLVDSYLYECFVKYVLKREKNIHMLLINTFHLRYFL